MTERRTRRSSAAAVEPSDAEPTEMTDDTTTTGDRTTTDELTPGVASATDMAGMDESRTETVEAVEAAPDAEPAAEAVEAAPEASEADLTPRDAAPDGVGAPEGEAAAPAEDEAGAAPEDEAAVQPAAVAVAEPVEEPAVKEPKRKGNGAAPSEPRPSGPRGLRVRYSDEVIPALMKQFEYANPNMVPRVAKIVVNVGLGEALTNAKAIDAASGDLTMITGQKPIVMKARRSIAQFRVRTGNPIGLKVTLRGQRMWDFLERLTMLALPRIRDFRGTPGRSFDGRGNYTLGLREQIAFPEIDYDKVDRLRGLEVSIVTTAKSDEESKRLLELLGMPFAS